jgi:hypothetical protein
LYVGGRPAFVENSLRIEAGKPAFSPEEAVAVSVRSNAPATPAILTILVANGDSDVVCAGVRHIETDSSGWRNLSLQDMFIYVRGLLEKGYYSYVVSARFPSDMYPRSNAAFTVYKYRYRAVMDRTSYMAGETAHLDLSILDVTDRLGIGNATHDEAFIVRLGDACGRALEISWKTERGVAHVDIALPCSRTPPSITASSSWAKAE